MTAKKRDKLNLNVKIDENYTLDRLSNVDSYFQRVEMLEIVRVRQKIGRESVIKSCVIDFSEF